MSTNISNQAISVLQLTDPSNDTIDQINTSPDDTSNKKESHDSEDLLGKTISNPLVIYKDILETNQVECDINLTEQTCSRSIQRQPLLISPAVSHNEYENDKAPFLQMIESLAGVSNYKTVNLTTNPNVKNENLPIPPVRIGSIPSQQLTTTDYTQEIG